MKRRGFFGLIVGGLTLIGLGPKAQAAPTIPPVTSVALTSLDGDLVWTGGPRPPHEIWTDIRRRPPPEPTVIHDHPVSVRVTSLYDNPRSHIKLPPVDPSLRDVNRGYTFHPNPASTVSDESV